MACWVKYLTQNHEDQVEFACPEPTGKQASVVDCWPFQSFLKVETGKTKKEIRDELASQDGHLSEPWLRMRDPASMNTVQSD